MIVVKIEMWPGGIGERAYEIGCMTLANDGASVTAEGRGNYDVAVMRRGTSTHGPANVMRTGRVSNFPRLSYNVWRLISRAILAAFPEEKG